MNMATVRKKDLDEIWSSIRRMNHEMGGVEASIKAIENDIKWVRDKIDKLDTRFYQILVSIFIVLISTIISFVIG